METVKQSKKVLVAEFTSGKVVFDMEAYRPYILNGTASVIWDYCRRRRSKKDIAEYLGRRYDAGTSAIRRDVNRFVRELKKKGLFDTHGRTR